MSFKRVLIVLDSTQSSPALLDAAELVDRTWSVETYFVLCTEIEREPLIEELGSRLGRDRKAFRAIGLGEDKPDAALDASESHDCSLIICREDGMGTQRLVRKSPRSLLVLPSRAESMDRDGPLLVPVDFGHFSEQAVAVAFLLAAALRQPPEMLHVYSVGPGYGKLGYSFEEFVVECERNYGERLTKIARAASSTGIQPRQKLVRHTKPAEAILDIAEAEQHAQIVLGSRPRTPLAGLILPSVAEKVVLSSPLPVWVIRDSAGRKGAFESILDL